MAFQQYNIYAGLTPVKACATGNVSGTYFNGSTNNGVGATLTLATGAFTVDGYSVQVGDRILLPFQTSANQNGIYVCTTAGATGIAAVLERAEDMQCVEQLLLGQFVTVGSGTLYGGSIFTVVSIPAAFGINDLTFNTSTVASGVTDTYAGGGTSHSFTVTGMAAGKVVVANILTSTNSVSITKVVPTTNTLTITFSADPGAGTTVNWIAA